jgi:hypothetical protein
MDVTGFAIEAIPHDDLPGFGPGLNPNGNFVVSEVEVGWRHEGKDEKERRIGIAAVEADYNQQDFDVSRTLNGKYERDDQGWAIQGAQRRPHTARFRLSEPLSAHQAGRIIVRIYCQYGNGDFPLACFRLWVTDSARPLAAGIHENVATVVLLPREQRAEDQMTLLHDYFMSNDLKSLKLRQFLALQRRPLPPDTKLLDLQRALELSTLPVEDDPTIVRLRQDVEHSAAQVTNRRLTAAQDLVWALINSTQFLFNH